MSCGTISYDELSLCHAENEKKRCPHCGGLRTKRKGFSSSIIRTNRGSITRRLQRYYCFECKTSFSSSPASVSGHRSRHSLPHRQKAVLEYVYSKSSSREVGRRYDVSHQTVLNWTYRFGKQINEDRIPGPTQWSGYICFDGQESKVKGHKRVLLLAVDAYNSYPFVYRSGLAENRLLTEAFLEKVAGTYPVSIRGITSDFGRGKCFVVPVSELLPQVLHQICLVHYQRYVWQFIPRTRRSKFFWRNAVLKELIRRTIKAEDRDTSLYWLNTLLHFERFFRATYHRRFLRSIRKNYALLTAHYDDPELPKTTNVAENLNRQLKRKLKNLDGFKADETREIFIKLWLACYRLNNMKINPKLWSDYLWNN